MVVVVVEVGGEMVGATVGTVVAESATVVVVTVGPGEAPQAAVQRESSVARQTVMGPSFTPQAYQCGASLRRADVAGRLERTGAAVDTATDRATAAPLAPAVAEDRSGVVRGSLIPFGQAWKGGGPNRQFA